MKKILTIVLVLVLCVTSMTVAASASSSKTVTVILDGQPVNCEKYGQPAEIINNRTMVPLRAIFEALDSTVEWDGATRAITAEKEDAVIKLAIGSSELRKSGDWGSTGSTSISVLDAPPLIKNNRTLVPLRAVSEAFGVKVEWNGTTRTATLTTLKDISGLKTLGAIEDAGYSFAGYTAEFNEHAIFYYRSDTRHYDVYVDITEEEKNELMSMDYYSDSYDEELKAFRRSLDVKKIKHLKEPLTDTELAEYTGKKIKSLLEDDFDLLNPTWEEDSLCFDKDRQCYGVFIDKEIMDSLNFEDNSWRTKIYEYDIEKIEYLGTV